MTKDQIVAAIRSLQLKYSKICCCVKECLGISSSGDASLVLNQQGDWVPGTGASADIFPLIISSNFAASVDNSIPGYYVKTGNIVNIYVSASYEEPPGIPTTKSFTINLPFTLDTSYFPTLMFTRNVETIDSFIYNVATDTSVAGYITVSYTDAGVTGLDPTYSGYVSFIISYVST